MAPREERELARIRAALEEEIEHRTLRDVALEVRMRPSGLRKFLGPGTIPYGPTWAKVRAWYQRWRDGAGLSEDDVEQQLRRLLRWLPDPSDGIPEVLDSIARVHHAAYVCLPPWFAGLRSRHPSPVEAAHAEQCQ